MKEFKLKPEIKYGSESLGWIKNLKSKKILIVTDKTMVKLGLVDKVISNLNGSEVKVFDKVLPNPTVEVIKDGIKEFFMFNPEVIIALGGGSPIDACKGIIYFSYKIQKEHKGEIKRIPFIAIPTTSGTGSEVTSYSVITNENSKIALADDEMLPTMAILDPEFMKTLPKVVIADTGMDVLTHAIEAYVSNSRNSFTNALSLESIKIIYKNLLNHYENSQLLKPREEIQHASCMAGLSFNNSSLGINHSIAHTLGSNLHLSHGRSNAIIMPYIIENNKNAYEYYYEISKMLGLPSKDIIEGKNSLIAFITIFKEKMKIPNSLKDLGIEFEEYKKLIPQFLDDIKKDICTAGNPNKFTDEEYVELLIKLYYGLI
ncbi:MAG TPA: butanol dehydrogenase [Fusobacteriaceae bacterium]|nr:butanol dehydrogenase [Fusobacteriaceae bacterium]